ncbi:hypothetical protein MA16_Dca017799 [Dendrobium catenatum]|uniref:Uncharacterized protein n=1 Tax=Dendrobium catenatum TaxID=906689 RepID=A0A2I0VD78_9ASPA|nr:hypothetical protein MA16_Dca017799 [Dendrobium catenatum]
MGFFRRIGTILGFVKDEAHAVGEEDGDKINDSAQRRPGRGFSVQVPVAAEKPSLGPVIIPCSLGEGGVQVHFSFFPFSILGFLSVKISNHFASQSLGLVIYKVL